MLASNHPEDMDSAIGNPDSHRATGNVSDRTYALVNAQSGFSSDPRWFGYVVAGVFVAAVIAMVVTLTQGTDSRKLVAGLACVAVVNLLVAVVWASRSTRLR